MKNLTLIVAIFLSTFLFAQNNFEGTIKYDITYEDVSEEIKPMLGMLPKSTTVTVKEGKSKTESANDMGGGTTVLKDSETGEVLTLTNAMGNKFAIKTNKSEEEKNPKIEKTDETKEILGYKCKKVIVESKEGETEIYYSEELKHIKSGTGIEGIDGFPLQIRLSTDYFTMIQTVKEIKEEKVKKIKMEAPADYPIKTKEEVMKMMGGGM